MSDEVVSRVEVLSLILRLAALTTVSYYTMKLLMDAVDPTRKQKLAAQKRAEKLLKRCIHGKKKVNVILSISFAV